MHPNINIAVRAARRAGDLMLRALPRLNEIEIQEKQHNDYVTEVDIKAEQVIMDVITAAYPDDSFLAEEHGEIINADPETVWVIDPIDGTLNFLHGYPHFCVSIAKKVKGRVEQAVIFNPATHDLFTATRGEGAHLNDRRIRVSKRIKLHGSLVATSLPRARGGMPLHQKILDDVLPNIGAVRRSGSTALDLAYVAAGYLDAFICDHFQEWDVAAGMLLVREAGGMVIDLQGGDAMLDQGTVLASNPKLLKLLLPQLS